MSHLKERKEKVCLNCNAALHGTYCHICGQENIEPKESAWHLVVHFFNDITHFDGKFFDTLRLLVTRPGFLSSEYARGRRASYLNPIRMYVFTSAVFFLIFFSLFHVTDQTIDNTIRFDDKSVEDIRAMGPDSLAAFTSRINKGTPLSHAQLEKYLDSLKTTGGFHLTGRSYKSKAEYDSLLKAGVKKHNWLERKLIYKEIEANAKFSNNRKAFFTSLVSTFVHRFPQMLFISLPIFALILKLLYFRRKEYYYVSHGIFSVHLYIFIFISLLFLFASNQLKTYFHWDWLIVVQRIIAVIMLFYLYKAMRNFYRQGRGKTIVKFLLLNLLSIVMILIIFFAFLIFSFMKI
ncbi:MAG: DUF3667 domain-containing protein [Bacteroidota bacterium]|nr:DUF3667 domain-containing protein [Ferruginibacter sp.]